MCVLQVASDRAGVEIEAVPQGSPEQERPKCRTLVEMEHCGVIKIVIRPTIGKCPFPSPYLLPVAEEYGVCVNVDTAKTMGNDESSYVRQNYRKSVIRCF